MANHARRIGRAPEVAHVRVQGLGPGDGEHDRAQRDEGHVAVVDEEADPVRVGEIARRMPGCWATTLPRPAEREEREPDPHDRSERPPDRAGPVALDGEQHREDDERDRDDEVLQRGRRHLEALDRREDRDRRRDHPVAVEQRSAEDPERDERGLGRATLEAHAALDERDEGHDPALALVVGAHDEGHVLDRDDDRDRPEDERDHAVDAVLGRRARRGGRRRRPSAARRAGSSRCRRRRHPARRR